MGRGVLLTRGCCQILYLASKAFDGSSDVVFQQGCANLGQCATYVHTQQALLVPKVQ